ncbi:enoyl-CoA hydratase/isomerase family protein [Ulvibacterium marinum]|uniref:Enoyl-CoA hydratase/isomerase family protein n=1 Tax=Ulvibacterium marinum TaxID=2419782 RepID=A0A3B0CBX5_9FLAO|nr:enoyl-CoA hydratase/isomerase family protein [Ulvibacterium marinum]RKN83443.1 enoyl-CoA hydratase/isomerase family protein [Ulvibacterium marinum]
MILTDLNEGILTITLKNPSKMNCMGFEMLHGLKDAITKAQKDTEIEVVVLKGAGERAFSSGADTKEFAALSPPEVEKWIRSGNDIFNQLEQLPKPTVAFLNGYVMGGGLELALACDFRLATSSVVISSPELGNGWLPGWGGMTRLRRLIGEANAKRVVLLSERFDAESSNRLGLLTIRMTDGKEAEELQSFVDGLKSKNSKAYGMAKLALMDVNRTTSGTAIDFDILAVSLSREN